MQSVLDQEAATLEEAERQDHAAAVAEGRARYITLINRRHAPHPGDAKALLHIRRITGITTAEHEANQRALDEIPQLRERVNAMPPGKLAELNTAADTAEAEASAKMGAIMGAHFARFPWRGTLKLGVFLQEQFAATQADDFFGGLTRELSAAAAATMKPGVVRDEATANVRRAESRLDDLRRAHPDLFPAVEPM